MSNSMPVFRDFVLLTALAAIFGGSFIFTDLAVRELSPLSVVFARLALATLLLYPLMRWRGLRLPKDPKLWLFIICAAFFGNALPFSLISWGQVRVDAGLTAIFMAVMPLLTVILAHMVTDDEKMNRLKLIGVLLGLLGVIVLFGWDKLGTLGEDQLRQYAIIGGALCYAINAILTKYLTSLPRLSMMTALTLTATLMLLPICFWFEAPLAQSLSVRSAGSLIYLAIGPTALATLLILDIIDRQGASFLSQINFMVPLFGVAFGWIFLGESLPPVAWMALLIILLGIGVSRLGGRRPG